MILCTKETVRSDKDSIKVFLKYNEDTDVNIMYPKINLLHYPSRMKTLPFRDAKFIIR